MGVNITAVVIQVHVSVGKVPGKADNQVYEHFMCWLASNNTPPGLCVRGFEENKLTTFFPLWGGMNFGWMKEQPLARASNGPGPGRKEGHVTCN